MHKLNYYPISLVIISAWLATPSLAIEINTHGITDLRIGIADTSQSHLAAGQGKFSNSDGLSLSLAQFGVETDIRFDHQFSAKIVLNGSYLAEDAALGITEAYVKYKGLPTSSGWRLETKAGFFYPKISLENDAFAWSSINTLNSSMINTWVAEEIRLTGAELKFTHLGKFSGQNYDWSISGAAFINNDPSSALLSWHGWTTGSRQTGWGESVAFPQPLAAQPGGPLAEQAKRSKPFDEIDHRLGYQVHWDYQQANWGKLNLGYYDNRAQSFQVTDGQYGWGTKFVYAGIKLKLPAQLQLTAQYLEGNNLMQSPDRQDIVKNAYKSGFIMLSKRRNKHGYAMRIEEFQVDDRDNTAGDDNNEYGTALTFSYNYRYSKPLFLATEINIIKSRRPARAYQNLAIKKTEQQLQFSARYFF